MATAVDMSHDLKSIGDEWAPRSHTLQVISDFILPYICKDSVVAEIGVGGGRIAVEIYHEVDELHCYDISKEMLTVAKKNIMANNLEQASKGCCSKSIEERVHFHHILTGEDHHILGNYQFDFIYA